MYKCGLHLLFLRRQDSLPLERDLESTSTGAKTVTNLNALSKTQIFRDQVIDVFLEAMRAGYATSPKKGHIAELPGSKTIVYSDGPWQVTDAYIVTPLGAWSGGTTLISYGGIATWLMQYFGEYEEEAIPCLKAALQKSYGVMNEFIGGRGPRHFAHDGYVYRNEVSAPRPLLIPDYFRGEEEIRKRGPGGRICGWHSYQGGMLF